MSGRETEIKGQFTKSVGAGLGAVMGGGGSYYVLEYKTPAGRFPAGHRQEVIVNYLELGRDPKCGLRFSEQDRTVSRKHAAITREGDSWALVNLSQTNPTLLNGRPVTSKWYLQSGDEIQLSNEGPRLGFLIPANNKAGSLGLSRRLSLFRQQAMRPYKTAMMAMGMLLLLVIAGGAYGITYLMQENKQQQQTLVDLEAKQQLSAALADSLVRVNQENKELMEKMQRDMGRIRQEVRNRPTPPPSSAQGSSPTPGSGFNQDEMNALYPDVYHINADRLTLTYPDGSSETVEGYSWSGTGFLTADGRFITARHVIEPWFFPSPGDELMFLLNILQVNAGVKVEARIRATSPSGRQLTFKGGQFWVDRSKDARVEANIEGESVVVQIGYDNPNDGSYINAGASGSLVCDTQRSTSLRTGESLVVLGYPLGIGASEAGNMAPIFGRTTVARPGLENGSIITTDRTFDHGNSGGPVFYRNEDGTFVVVGLISGGMGDAIGRIVPVSLLY
jgi:S1-C subfamily serine protease